MGIKIGKIIKGIVQVGGRVIDQVFTGGIIHNVLEETKIITSNDKTVLNSEKGKVDYPKWFAMFLITLPVWLIIALKMGWLTMEEVNFIFDSIEDTK